jgi:hypothetical protein
MKRGIYEHYRGGKIEVIGTAIADWDGSTHVVYKDLDTNITKIQSLRRFSETVVTAISPIKKKSRFTLIKEIKNGH